jgi:hypothetical protein
MSINQLYYLLEHRPLKIRTDGSHARVRELGSIGIFSIFAVTLSKMVSLLPNFEHKLPQTTQTNLTNLVIVRFLLPVLFTTSFSVQC